MSCNTKSCLRLISDKSVFNHLLVRLSKSAMFSRTKVVLLVYTHLLPLRNDCMFTTQSLCDHLTRMSAEVGQMEWNKGCAAGCGAHHSGVSTISAGACQGPDEHGKQPGSCLDSLVRVLFCLFSLQIPSMHHFATHATQPSRHWTIQICN
jgi:hypothetical protein